MSDKEPMHSPLTLDGWLEFNRVKWGLKPIRMRYSEEGKELPALETVLYLNKLGKLRMPPRNTYLPVVFKPTSTSSTPRLSRQWIRVSGLMAKDFRRRGLAGTLAYPSEVKDVRAWQWEGFIVGLHYSIYLDLPYPHQPTDAALRNKIKKSVKNGFTCERETAFADILECLQDTEERQTFAYDLTLNDLKMAHQLLGDMHFKCYVCYAPNGRAASTRIILHRAGGRAMDWLAGTKREYLNSGATQLVTVFALDDLAEAGALGFDYAGANISTVAAAKLAWGGCLVPYYTISKPGIKSLAKSIVNTWQFLRNS